MSTIRIITQSDLVKTLSVIGATTISMLDRYELEMADGTAAGQADIVVPVELTIAASGNASIDLDSLTDVFGDAADAAKLKSILIYHDAASAASQVTLTGDALDTALGATVSMALPVGDHLSFSRASAGIAVSASSDVVTITNNDATHVATVKVIILATSA